MARAQSTDFYHVFKFHLQIVTAGVDGASAITGGFTNVVIPEISLENVEYKEGLWLYKRKYAGAVTFSDITCTQGVIKKNTAAYDWIMAAHKGSEYRVDLRIMQYHREDVTNLHDFTGAKPSRVYNCYECIPSRVKVSSDLDATASEIALAELDIQIERMELVEV